ncbi:hypothetical protein UY3_02680 [Chelonia mydas]|uniref:Uncharacterized protein n=1 Tax=Chelonia mydas TaxID=8469 RepID=M7C6G3_CHEMY|nr:hypothetical protein UY3_02680 [Chelonia mydas]
MLPGTVLGVARDCTIDFGSGHGVYVESGSNDIVNSTDCLHAGGIPGDIRPVLPLSPILSTGSRVRWCCKLRPSHPYRSLGGWCFLVHCRAAGLIGTTAHNTQTSDCGVEVDTGTAPMACLTLLPPYCCRCCPHTGLQMSLTVCPFGVDSSVVTRETLGLLKIQDCPLPHHWIGARDRLQITIGTKVGILQKNVTVGGPLT